MQKGKMSYRYKAIVVIITIDKIITNINADKNVEILVGRYSVSSQEKL